MKMLAIFLLLFSATALAQTDALPIRGDIADIKAKTHFYLIADGIHPKYIRQRIKKPLVEVDDPEKAEFFIEYITVDSRTETDLDILIETGTLNIFYYRDGRKVIAWTDTDVGGLPSKSLSRKAYKALTKK